MRAGGYAVTAKPLRVLVCARYPAVRSGLRELLNSSGIEAVEWSPARRDALDDTNLIDDIDVIVTDLDAGSADLPAGRGADWARLPSVMLVDGAEQVRPGAVDEPARGWLLRDASAEELSAAVRAVAAGIVVLAPPIAREVTRPAPDLAALDSPALTGRESEVLRLVAAGLPNKTIARELEISEHTVKFHVGSILSKLDARSRTEAVTLAARRGLLTL